MAYPRSQSGSVASFIVVALVLVGLVAGAVFFARHRGEVADSAKRSDIAKQDTPDSSDKKQSDDKKTQDNKHQQTDDAAKKKAQSDAKKKIASDKDAKPTDTKDKKSSTQKKDKKTDVADKKKTETTQQQATPKKETSSGSTPMERSTNENTGGAALPTTGPTEDILTSVVGLVAILGAGYVYYHFGRK